MAPPLLPIFRSAGQARLLEALFLDESGRGNSIAELARATGAPVASVHREVERLEAAGLVRSERVGRARLVSADATSPVHEELRGLIHKTLGPAALLRTALADVEGIEHASIFGSWAARYLGEPGDAPADIDLLVVGRPVPDAVHEACDRIEERLARPVNVVILSPDEWAGRRSGFLRSIGRQVRVPVVGEAR